MRGVRFEFPYKNDHTKGIFNFLRNGIIYPIQENIIVTNSSVANGYSPYYPFGINNADFSKSWNSENYPESWLTIQFLKFKVRIDSYSTKSYNLDYPKSWVLEGTNNNGSSWHNISYVTGRTSLPSDRMYHGDSSNKNYYSKFRIKMFEQRQGSSSFKFEIFLLEFFGGIQLNSRGCTRNLQCGRGLQQRVCVLIFIVWS